MTVRVLFVVPHLSGSMRLLATILRHLRRDQFVATLLVLGQDLTLKDEFPDEILIQGTAGGAGIGARLCTIGAVVRAARDQDLIIAWAELTPTYLTAIAGRIVGKPVIGWVHIHLSMIFGYGLRPAWAHRRIMKLIYPRLDRVVGVSATVCRDLEQEFALGNVTDIPNSIDLDFVRGAAKESSVAPGPGRLPRPLLVAMGVLCFQKGFDNLIAAHARVRAAGIAHDLVILGEGEAAGALQALARDLAVSDSVHFRGHLKNPYPVIASADGFVLSSRFEGFALVVAEALALGVPVIATRVAGPDEILDGGRYGPLVAVDDVDGLAAEMKRLLTDDAWHGSLKQSAVTAAERYDCRSVVPQIEALFESVLAQSSYRR
ncbi:MAG: glycosyltransferase [Azospirillaceae bacterium]|nr:glycosyltransferase [Azospirillaceae bacterium]